MMKYAIATARQSVDKHGQEMIQIEDTYAQYIEEFKIQLIILPSLSDIRIMEQFQPVMILLTGGGDAPAIYYDAAVECNLQQRRDEIEIKLIQYAINNNIPLLGICRGMQVINGYFGGKITREPTHSHPVAVSHIIECVDEGILYETNSFHRDVIQKDALSKELTAIAYHENAKHVEAYIGINHPILGLQWHPERIDKNAPCRKYSNKLIAELISKGGVL